MNINSSQSIHSNNPLDTSSARRVTSSNRVSSVNDSDDATENKAAEKAQQLQDESFLRDLRARDREVRAHEAAHVAAGSGLIRGGPSFTYQTGPDGRTYAIGGEVQLDVSAVSGNPEATITKSEQIRKAALAPVNPSAQDVNVAANASQLAAKARVDLAIQRREEAQLEKELKSLDEATDTHKVDSIRTDLDTGSDTASLQSNEASAVAATNSFMTTAQTQVAPPLFSQFV